MRYLFSEFENVRGRLSNLPLLLFADFDGTLAPIVAKPEHASLAGRAKEALAFLAGSRSCKVAVVSGRALADIRQRVGLETLTYAGNHGLEISGPQVSKTVSVGPEYFALLKELKPQLEIIAGGFPGALVEDKGVSLSVHYRAVDVERIDALLQHMRSVLSAYGTKNMCRVKNGKMVLEVRPPVDWDKGKAVRWLADTWSADPVFARRTAVYIGDDATDEDAFKALASDGMTVFVGGMNQDSAAQYYLNSPADVEDLLVRLAGLKGGKL